ncbi:MAG: hypothetical protein L3J59_07005 [Methylococcaceae bacterium]|nr:hypothetical protein [Methylococcaceae bacterium]
MEAVALTAENIDLSEKPIIFKTLKQRHKAKFRAIPIPDHVIYALELVHGIRKAQRVKKKAPPIRAGLWCNIIVSIFI